MRKFVVYVFVFIGFHVLQAQINEIGVLVGGSNPISDIGDEFYMKPTGLSYGILYKWNAHRRFSFRVQITENYLYADDGKSDVESKKNRNFKFDNRLIEASVGVEYHFDKFDLSRSLSKPSVPYIYMGLAYVWYDDLYFDMSSSSKNLHSIKIQNSDVNAVLPKKIGGMAIPIGLGFKAKISQRFLVSLELGLRYTFTNNLDGSYPTREDLQKYRFGNRNSNDWYSTIGLSLTYTFGEYPCYCIR